MLCIGPLTAGFYFTFHFYFVYLLSLLTISPHFQFLPMEEILYFLFSIIILTTYPCLVFSLSLETPSNLLC